MPEGDTVFRQAAVLHAALGGKVLTASDFRVPSYATVDLSGRTVQRVIARGKHLLMQFGDLTVHSHLKMEGTWHVYPRDAQGGRPQWRRPAHTARCVLRTQDHEAVGFSLGELDIFSPTEEQERLGHLGPDLLGPDWDPAEATRRLLSAPQRSIGVALLDQRNLAGVGNVFRSEICFLAGILPTRPVAEVANLARVIELSEKLLHREPAADPPMHHRQPHGRSAVLGLRARRQALYALRHPAAQERARRAGAAQGRRGGPGDLLLPVLPELNTPGRLRGPVVRYSGSPEFRPVRSRRVENVVNAMSRASSISMSPSRSAQCENAVSKQVSAACTSTRARRSLQPAGPSTAGTSVGIRD